MLAETIRTPVASSTSTTRTSCWSRRSDCADDRPAGEPRQADAVRALPRSWRWPAPTARSRRSSVGRLLPRQDRVADQGQQGRGRAARGRGAGASGGPGDAAGRRVARRRTSCWATRSRSRGSPSTPIRPAGPAVRLDQRDRPGEGRARHRRVFPKREWTMLSHHLIWHGRRVCRAQARLWRVHGRATGAPRTARVRPTRSQRPSWCAPRGAREDCRRASGHLRTRYTKAILNTVANPLVVLDAALRVQSANRVFYSTFGVSRDKVQGTALRDLGGADWKASDLWAALTSLVAGSQEFQPFEIEREFPAAGRRTLLFDARRVMGEGDATTILLAAQDITERKQTERELQSTNSRKDEFLALLAHELRNPIGARPHRVGADSSRRRQSGIGATRATNHGTSGWADGAADRRSAGRVEDYLGKDRPPARADVTGRPDPGRRRRTTASNREVRNRTHSRHATRALCRRCRPNALRSDFVERAAQCIEVHAAAWKDSLLGHRCSHR